MSVTPQSLLIKIKGAIQIFGVVIISIFLVFIINSLKNDSFSFASHFKNSGTSADFSGSIRLNYWRGAWEMFKDRPLTGRGAGTFGTVYHLYQKDPISAGRYAHNLYLEMLSEQGIFVFGFFVLFLAAVLGLRWLHTLCGANAQAIAPQSAFRFHTQYGASEKSPHTPFVKGGSLETPLPPFRRRVYTLGLFAGLLAFLIHNGIDIDWHFGADALAFWIFLGLFYNVSREKYVAVEHGKKQLFTNCHCEKERSDDVAISGKRTLPRLLRCARDDREKFLLSIYKFFIFLISFLLIFFGIVFLHSDYYFQKGTESQQNGNLEEAQKFYGKSVFLNPNPDYLRQYGIIFYSRGELAKALEVAEEVIKYDAYSSLNYELRGKIEERLGDIKEAEIDFRKSIELNKFNPRLYINFAIVLINEGRKDKAREIINKILSYYPEKVVSNREMYIMNNQEITSGIEKDIESLRYLLKMADDAI